MRFVFGACALWLASAQGGLGDTDSGHFVIKGAGQATCGAYVKAFEARDDSLQNYGGWLDGYVTGINRYEDQLYDLTPWQSTELLLALLAQSCTETPDLSFIAAANTLLSDFSANRLATAGDFVDLRNDTQTVMMHSEVLDRVYQRLSEEGFDPGEPTSHLTPELAEALAQFQTAREISQTGFPDQTTLMRLFVVAD